MRRSAYPATSRTTVSSSLFPPPSPSSSPSPSPSAFAPPPPTKRTKPLSLLILGSGGSAAVPDIACVTSPATGCHCCLSTLDKSDRTAQANVRGNTGAVIRVPPEKEGGEEKTILLDCGKTFREQALKYFPKAGLRKIDACILTHHHADAIDGLDDLRAWTYQCAIEQTIPIYLTRTTFSFIQSGFPYMVSKAAASGGGALPSFEWHIMPEDGDWEVCGLNITPLPVHHGHYFNKEPPPPLICLGFLIDSSVLYMSDVSYIPESTWQQLSQYLSLPSQNGLFPAAAPSSSLSPVVFRPSTPSLPALPRLQALIIDSNGLHLSPSHFALPQAIATARRLGVVRTYFTNLGHEISHSAWLSFSHAFGEGRHSCEAVAQGWVGRATPAWKIRDEAEQQPPWEHVMEGWDPHVEDHELFAERALEAVEQWAGGVLPGRWCRPLRDGMTIAWDRGGEEGGARGWDSGRVWDDEYEQ
ncbi:hypothetical protein JCM10213_008919 [Rhodosporidiobolus nylandii]